MRNIEFYYDLEESKNGLPLAPHIDDAERNHYSGQFRSEAWLYHVWKLLKWEIPNKPIALLLIMNNFSYSYEKIRPLDTNGKSEIVDDIIAYCKLIECFGTIICLEGQQRAVDLRESKRHSKDYKVRSTDEFMRLFWIRDFPNEFYEELFSIGNKYHIVAEQKETWIKNCKVFTRQCKMNPIASMLLPFLFTEYLLAQESAVNCPLYIRLEPRKHRLSRQDTDRIVSVYKEVRDAVESVLREPLSDRNGVVFAYLDDFRQKFKPFIPIFNWSKLIMDFCKYQLLPENEWTEVWSFFKSMRYKNSLSKKEIASLYEKAYGKALHGLFRLCNYTFFTESAQDAN